MREAVVFLITAVSLAGLPAGGPTARPEGLSKLPTRGEAVAVNVERGPVLDGTMRDPVWNACPRWALGACTSDDPQKYATWAKVLFDGTSVYVGIHCEEPDTEGIVATVTRRDGPVWDDDSVEVFLRPDPREPYFQLVVNPRGTIYDARDRDPAWTSSAEVKTSIDRGRSWSATIRIPMKETSACAAENQTWTMNIYRSRTPRGGDPAMQYSWSIMTGNDYHADREFGIVTGVNVPRRADGVTRVRETPAPRLENRGTRVGGVTVYRKMTFDDGVEGWEPANGGKLALTDDAVHGKALHVACGQGWSGARLPIGISGSRGLRMALLMKGQGMPAAGVNIHDTVAQDNTTPYGYRTFKDGGWTPILYFLDRCRYNALTDGFVAPVTSYNEVRFYGPQEFQPGMAFTLDDLVIYRGADRDPPGRVTGLEARATPDGVRLSWHPAADNVGTQVYVVARADRGAFEKIAESHATTYIDATAGRGEYRYRVFAVDFEENFGPWSEPVSVRSTSSPRDPKPTREEEDRLGFAEHVRQVHARGAGKVRKGHATLFGDSLTGATVYPHSAEAAFGNMTVNAFGFAAMRTSFGRGKVGEILHGENPEFMFILYGTNNSKAPQDIPPAMDDLAAIVKACEDHGTVAVLGTIPPRGWTEESKPEAGFNKHVVELCRKLRIPTGYIFEDLLAAGDRKRTMGDDGVHWRGEGMAIAGQAWAKALDQIRFVLRDQR